MNQFMKVSRRLVTTMLITVALSSCAKLNVFSDKAADDKTNTVQEQQSQDVWRSGQQYVQLINKGKGSPHNDHPVKLSPEDMEALLSSAFVSGGFIIKSGESPVFSAGELQVLSRALAKALFAASVDEDAAFAITGIHQTTFDKGKRNTSGRAFVKAGELHIIFGLLNDSDDGANSLSAPLNQGSRLVEADLRSSLTLQAGQSFHRDPKTGDEREDWLVIDIDSVLEDSGLQGERNRSQVSPELLQDVAQSKKEADNIKQDISKMKEVIFELTDEVERLRQEVETLKQRR